MLSPRQSASIRPPLSSRASLKLRLEEMNEWLFGPDPGRLRLVYAMRALVGASITVAILLKLVGASSKAELSAVALGFMCSAISGRLIQDTSTRGVIFSLLSMYPVAIGGSAAASYLAQSRWIADGGLVLVSGAAILARLAGQRGFPLGMLGFITYFVCLIVRPGLSALPDMAIGIAVGFASAGFVRLVLIPSRPDRTLKHIVHDLDRRLLRIATELKSFGSSDPPDEARNHRLNAHLARLSDTILVALDQVETVDFASRDQHEYGPSTTLLAVEWSIERLARIALEDSATRRSSVTGRDERLPRAMEDLQRARAALRRLRRDTREAQPDAREKASPAPSAPAFSFGNPVVRQAIQAMVATALAVGAGSLLSDKRSYWAIIAAFVVQSGVSSKSETLIKASQRIAGTFAGVAVGEILAAAITGHNDVALGLALFCVFIAYYAFQQAYTTMIFAITLMLALLYGMMGQFSPGLLVLRLEETAIGAAAAVCSAFLVLPTRQDEAFRSAMASLIDAMERVVTESRWTEKKPSPDAVLDMRSKTQALRNSVASLKRGWIFLLGGAIRDSVRTAMRCDYLARGLFEAGHLSDVEAGLLMDRLRPIGIELGKPGCRGRVDSGPVAAEALSPDVADFLRELAELRRQLKAL